MLTAGMFRARVEEGAKNGANGLYSSGNSLPKD
jgi:hypothetical protein